MGNSNKRWWYSDGQKVQGSCSGAELFTLIAQGIITPQTWLTQEGMRAWIQAQTIPELWAHTPRSQQPQQDTLTQTDTAVPEEQSRRGWQRLVGEKAQGNYTGAELLQLTALGKITPETLIRRKGEGGWLPASGLPALWKKTPATPPASTVSSPSKQSSKIYWCVLDQAQAGPYSKEDLRQMLKQKIIHYNTLVWHSGADEWQFGTRVLDIFDRKELGFLNSQLPPATFAQAVSRCLSKFFDFSGRANRAEFWYFVLFYASATVFLYVSNTLAQEGLFIVHVLLHGVLIFPLMSVSSRRFHDIGRTSAFFPVIATLLFLLHLLIWPLALFAVLIYMQLYYSWGKETIEFLTTGLALLAALCVIYFLTLVASKGDPYYNQYGEPQ